MEKLALRLTLNGHATGIDGNNMAPSILYNLIRKYAPSELKLINGFKEYVKERENVLKTVIAKYEVTKSQAKDLFLAITFGGGYKKWFESNAIKYNEYEILKCITTYHKDCQHIINEIAPKHFPDFSKYQKIAKEKKKKEGNDWNIEGSAIAFYIQEHERIVIPVKHVYY
eukprot:1189735-Prorocentrum_minimum.AAC.1